MFNLMRTLFFAIGLWLALSLSGSAQDKVYEHITRMDVTVEVLKDGGVKVREEIDYFKPAGMRKRGIFRDLPLYVREGAVKRKLRYTLTRAERNGERENTFVSEDRNALRIRMGRESVFLQDGLQRYVIEYTLDEAVWRFDDLDEITWNITGPHWPFPIDEVNGKILLPEGATIETSRTYRGRFGSTAAGPDLRILGPAASFSNARDFGPGESMTVSLGFPKGIVDPLSPAERTARWWRANGALVGMGLVTPGILLFYLFGWRRVGRDPVKPPVFARYAPPEAYSAAAAHRIFYRTLKGNDALIATLLSLSIKGYLKIDVEKRATVLTRLPASRHKETRNAEEEVLFNLLFNSRKDTVTLRKSKPNSRFDTARLHLQSQLNQNYDKPYYRRNGGYTLAGIFLSIAGVFAVIGTFYTPSSLLFWGLVVGLVAANIIFMILMPAPTKRGAQITSEIEGFRLYLETAEKLRLNAAEIGSGRPPPMTVERYEAFLPYAVALDVEKPWTKHFEASIPDVAQDYRPQYYGGSGLRSRGIGGMQRDMVKALSSGVESAKPVSVPSSSGGGRSSSSGGFSSGGGFSGGGMGGGGGGSW